MKKINLNKKQKIIIIFVVVIIMALIVKGIGSIFSSPIDYTDSEISEEINTGEYQGDGDNLLEDSYVQVTEVPEGYIGIYTIEDLKNSGINENGKYILMDDLDMSSEKDWDGITNRGCFEGNLHTISNLTSNHSGLFEFCIDVQHLTLDNVNISIDEDNLNGEYDYDMTVGAIANECGGYIGKCTVNGSIQCKVTGKNRDVSGEKEYNSSAYIGGIAGKMFNDTNVENYQIFNCVNNIDISIDNIDAGYYTYISQTYYARGTSIAGGIVGYGEVQVDNCINNGKIDVSALELTDADNLFIEDGIAAAGGIAGYANCNNGETYISSCTNNGKVQSHCNSGGIVGYCGMYLSQITIEYCTNTGSIDCSNQPENSACGGIVGRVLNHNENNMIRMCVNLGIIYSTAKNTGSIVGCIDNNLQVTECTYTDNSEMGEAKLDVSGTGEMFADNTQLTLEEAEKQYPNAINNKTE